MRRILIFTLLLAPAFFQAQIDSINVLKPAAVKAVSSDERSPFAHTNISEQEISDRDAAQDLPFLIRFAPSVVVTSDAGNGIGYTGMRLRGTDATRINVTINGVPLNDAESMGVWWVDLPDLGSSISDLQISRGVGTSTNGPGAFGGSIAINTLGKVAEPMIQAKVGFGSFNSRRQSAMWNSGINEKGLSFDGRVSKITSDGYVNRASSDLFSLYGSLTKRWETGKISLTAMNGEERTYQSWYGVPEIVTQEGVSDSTILNWAYGSYDYGYGADTARVNDLIANGRQHNYYNYVDEVDDYTQTHHQLHIEQALGKANLGVSLFQTLGQGYYENQLIGADPLGFGLTQNNTPGDFVIRRWLDNTLRGGMFNFQREFGKLNVDFGGMYSNYLGDHFGRLLEVDTAYANMPVDSTFYVNVWFDNSDLDSSSVSIFGGGYDWGEFDAWEQPIQLGPYYGDLGAYELIIQDVNDPTCFNDFAIDSPSCLYTECDISWIQYDVIDCNPADSTFYLNVWFGYDNLDSLSVSIFGGGYDWGEFDAWEQPVQLGPFNGGEGVYEVIIQDTYDPECYGELVVDEPSCLFDNCNIEWVQYEIVDCNQTDSSYYLEIWMGYDNVSDSGVQVITNDTSWGYFDPSIQPIVIGPITDIGGESFIEVVDFDDPNCSAYLVYESNCLNCDLIEFVDIINGPLCDTLGCEITLNVNLSNAGSNETLDIHFNGLSYYDLDPDFVNTTALDFLTQIQELIH